MGHSPPLHTEEIDVRRRIGALLQSRYLTNAAPTDHGDALSVFPTGMRREQGNLLGAVARAYGAVRTIETGFALGLSGLFLLDAALEQDDQRARHLAIDPFQSTSWRNAGVRAFREAGASPFLELREEPSELALPDLIRAAQEFDLGFIDGNHLFEGALMDLTYMLRVVRAEGVIVIDDTWMPSVRTAVSFAVKNYPVVVDTKLGDDPSRWRRSRLGFGRRVRGIEKNMVVLVKERNPTKRDWTHFVPFSVG